MQPDHTTAARLAREYAEAPHRFDTVEHLETMLASTLHAFLEAYAERERMREALEKVGTLAYRGLHLEAPKYDTFEDIREAARAALPRKESSDAE